MPQEGPVAVFYLLLVSCIGVSHRWGFICRCRFLAKRGTLLGTQDVTAAVGQRQGEATRAKDIFPFPCSELLF